MPLGAHEVTPDQYVELVLAKYAVPRGQTSPAEQLGATVAGPVRTWAGQQLNVLEDSGSYAKETGVRGISDVDEKGKVSGTTYALWQLAKNCP